MKIEKKNYQKKLMLKKNVNSTEIIMYNMLNLTIP